MTMSKNFDIKSDYKEYSGDEFKNSFNELDRLSQRALEHGRSFHFSAMVDMGEGQLQHIDIAGSSVTGVTQVNTTRCEHGSDDFTRLVFKHYTTQLNTAATSIELAATKQDLN